MTDKEFEFYEKYVALCSEYKMKLGIDNFYANKPVMYLGELDTHIDADDEKSEIIDSHSMFYDYFERLQGDDSDETK